MFSVDSFVRINMFLRGVYRVAYLNLLWIAATVLGLVIFGIGPASYAVAAYIDRWFRLGDTPPVTRTFIADLRAQYWRAAATGWLLLAATTIVVTNIFSATAWILQFANILALGVIALIAAYVFPVMAATDVRGIPRQVAASFMIGVGSLHWTIIAGGAVALAFWLLATFAPPLLVLFGVGIPAAAFGFVTRIVFTQLVADDIRTSPPGQRATAMPHHQVARGITS